MPKRFVGGVVAGPASVAGAPASTGVDASAMRTMHVAIVRVPMSAVNVIASTPAECPCTE
jgi:hypothetical protein